MMQIFASPRQSGRTFKAVQYVKEYPEGRVIVVHSEFERERLIRAYDMRKSCVATFQDIFGGKFKEVSGKHVVIDNADFLFDQFCKRTLGHNWIDVAITEDTFPEFMAPAEMYAWRQLQLKLNVEERRPWWIDDVMELFPKQS